MRIFGKMLRKNIAGQAFVLLLSCLFALLSVHSFALVRGALYPLTAIESDYYDHSYYVSYKGFLMKRVRFQNLLNTVEQFPAYEGADYIYSIRDLEMGEGEAHTLRFCSRHMAEAFDLDLQRLEFNANELIGLFSTQQPKVEMSLTTPDGSHHQIKVVDRYPARSVVPNYAKRYHRGSAQLIYDTAMDPMETYVFVDDLDRVYPENQVIYPTTMTLFFTRPLSPNEEAQLQDNLGDNVFVTPISEMRQNTRVQTAENLSKVLPQPIIASFILFFSLLSISLLGSYKTRSFYRLLRQLGMTKRSLSIYLLAPMVFHGLVASIVYVLYNKMLNEDFFGRHVRFEGASYEPWLVVYFLLGYALFAFVVYVLLKVIIRQDERNASVL